MRPRHYANQLMLRSERDKETHPQLSQELNGKWGEAENAAGAMGAHCSFHSDRAVKHS